MKHILTLAAGLCIFGFSAPANAQTSQYENAILGQSMDVRVGVIIPFGGDRKSEKSKPQLALISRRSHSSRPSVDWAMKPDRVQNEYVETRLALTLSSQPELRLNGQEIYDFGGEQADLSDGVKTAGKVALGAGIIVATVAVVTVGTYALALATSDGPYDDG